MIRSEITATELADRLAIREFVDAYARCADRRDAEGQKSLFAEDTRFVVYMAGEGSEPTQVLDGREALTQVFNDLNRYQATMHFTARARSHSTATERPERATASPTTCSSKMASAS
jgi:SnoaL-like domain